MKKRKSSRSRKRDVVSREESWIIAKLPNLHKWPHRKVILKEHGRMFGTPHRDGATFSVNEKQRNLLNKHLADADEKEDAYLWLDGHIPERGTEGICIVRDKDGNRIK